MLCGWLCWKHQLTKWLTQNDHAMSLLGMKGGCTYLGPQTSEPIRCGWLKNDQRPARGSLGKFLVSQMTVRFMPAQMTQWLKWPSDANCSGTVMSPVHQVWPKPWQEDFSQFQDTTDAFPCHIHLPVCMWIMDPHSRAPMKNTSYGNEVLPQDTTHLIQRSCYQQGSPCQDPAGNWTTRRQPDDRKETQTAGVWTCLLFIRSGQNHLARHSERGKKTRQTEEEVVRQH